jgi:hypothetical protein
LLLKQVKLRTDSGLERPSEDLAMSDAAGGAGDAEYDERRDRLEGRLPLGQPATPVGHPRARDAGPTVASRRSASAG